MKFVTPSIYETAFNCPHCGALANQTWMELAGRQRHPKHPLPPMLSAGDQIPEFSEVQDAALRKQLVTWAETMMRGIPFFEEKPESAAWHVLNNVNLSTCFNCKKHCIWIHDKVTYPSTGEAPPANPDMSDDIRHDYNEANAILDVSPRGAAALIRLCIQKLCKELGLPGKNINDDIGTLVTHGLDKRIQQALDTVKGFSQKRKTPHSTGFNT